MERQKPMRKPDWLKIRIPDAIKAAKVRSLLSENNIHTICTSGMCPNKDECWRNGTATFMIGGDICTRSCKFCNVATGRPLPLDPTEISGISDAIKKLHLSHAVITSVDRDDLPDLGASHWVATIKAIRRECPGVTMETLIPDFQGRSDLVDMIIDAGPEVISHNIETVRRLTPELRCKATYDNSLGVIAHVAASCKAVAKSGLMLGVGETEDEVIAALDDLRHAGCSVVTIGQYLQPSESHYPVKEYVHPDIFAKYKRIALEKGFRHVESSPLVRSSYHAHLHVK